MSGVDPFLAFARARLDDDEASVDRDHLDDFPDDSPALNEVALQWYDRRSLAEAEAKRRLLGWHEIDQDYPRSGWVCALCVSDVGIRYGDPVTYHEAWPCPTLRAVFAVYSEHEDYREEWRV